MSEEITNKWYTNEFQLDLDLYIHQGLQQAQFSAAMNTGSLTAIAVMLEDMVMAKGWISPDELSKRLAERIRTDTYYPELPQNQKPQYIAARKIGIIYYLIEKHAATDRKAAVI